MAEKAAIVFGTYQRLALLKRAVASVRLAVGRMPYKMIIVDGGSTDGSRAWLASQKDVVLIQQSGPLTGAVRAFNLGFGRAVDDGFDYVVNFNDDAEFITSRAIEQAICILQKDRTIGQVAFEFSVRGGPLHLQEVYGKTYANYGCARRDIGMMVAQQQGDVSGRNWWNPIYRTYGADAEFSCWIWKLGFRVYDGKRLCINHHQLEDRLRTLNGGYDPNRPEVKIFWGRWPHAAFGQKLARATPLLKSIQAFSKTGKATHPRPMSVKRKRRRF